jgi:N-acetylmuramoyl-L-alanine amidase
LNQDSTLANDLAPSPNHGDRRGKSVDCMILHYTGMSTGPSALARLRDPGADVSCHYLVWEDSRITQLVPESLRAWHAGLSFWAGETDMNSVSIGIEIVNKGHDSGCPPYPSAQIAAVTALCQDLASRHNIPTHRILAHSDIAPGRKIDPGEWFPWEALAAAGIGLWAAPVPVTPGPVMRRGDQGPGVERLQSELAGFGYGVPVNGTYCEDTEATVAAFQRHWRQTLVDGAADVSTVETLRRLKSLSPGRG